MGSFEEAKGRVKEAVGDLSDNPELRREGRAQEEKAEDEREATQARAEARDHQARARERESAEKAAQADK